ncbi:hypothetical protein Bca4012_084296 [Brassica carinata]
MASPEKEKKTKQELLPSLPDDLSLSCFARISRLYHPALSLVSLHSLSTTKCRWFTLFRKPDHQTSEAKSSWYVLAPASTLHTPHAMSMFSGIVAVCSDIYNIGSSFSTVSVLDWIQCAASRPSEAHVLTESSVWREIKGWFVTTPRKDDGTFRWYDTEVNMWRCLKGLEGQLPNFVCCVTVRLADYGGKMAVLWDQNKYYHVEKRTGVPRLR